MTGTSPPTPGRSRSRRSFPGAVYENAFGTVAVQRDGVRYEITTFRRDHDYADFRRPHRVEFGATIEEDLARRDFTVNALAWGARAGRQLPAWSIRSAAGPTSSGAAWWPSGCPPTASARTRCG